MRPTSHRRRSCVSCAPLLACGLLDDARVAEDAATFDRADNLVVIRSQPGTAPGVAAAVDAASLHEVIGSVAGNDTVLVVSGDVQSAIELVNLINKLSHTRK